MKKIFVLCVACLALMMGTQCYASEIDNIEVTNLEIANYDKVLNVDETMDLTVTVLPEDATDTTVTYKSSNSGIATVNSTGEIKGIAPGEVIIYVTAGNITKEARITVKIPTKNIQVNGDYHVLKPGATYQIQASVKPEGAARDIIFKTTNEKVASVSSNGLITAKSCGNAAIMVTNGDIHVSVSVLVNQSHNETNTQTQVEELHVEQTFPEDVKVAKYAVVSAEMLKYFYDNQKKLTIHGDGYTMYLDGKDIVNYKNELKTVVQFQKEENGTSFVVNGGNKLCGKITIDLSEKIKDEKYLYLYNEHTNKYQRVEVQELKRLTLDTGGTYLITSDKLSDLDWNIALIGIGVVAVVVGIGVYIGVKKKYWFW